MLLSKHRSRAVDVVVRRALQPPHAAAVLQPPHPPRRAAIDEWEAEQKLRELESGGEYTRVKTSTDTETTRFAAHVALPDDAHIEREVLNRKKRELLAKYKSDDLLAQEADAKKMLH